MDPITFTIALGASGAGGAAESYWFTISYETNQDPSKVQALAVGSSGNVFTTGTANASASNTNMTNQHGLMLNKYDSDGNYQFSRKNAASDFLTGINERLAAVAVDSNDNAYIVADRPLRYVSGAVIFGGAWIIKYNSSGTRQWHKMLGNTNSQDAQFSDIAIDSNDNIFAFGRARNSGSSSYCYPLVKYNTSGVVQFQKQITGSGAMSSESAGLAIDSSGNFYLTGFSVDAAVTVKLNSSLAVQWSRSYALSGTEPMGRGIGTDSSGNVYVRVNVFDSANNRLIKYNSSGTLQWEREFTDNSSSDGSLAVDSSGNSYVTGKTTSNGTNFMNIIKFNSSGTVQWKRKISGSEGNGIFGRHILHSGDSLYVTAKIDGHGLSDFVGKIPDDGSLTGTYSTTDFGNVVYESSSISTSTPSATTDSAHTASVSNLSLTAADSGTTSYNFTRNGEENITLS